MRSLPRCLPLISLIKIKTAKLLSSIKASRQAPSWGVASRKTPRTTQCRTASSTHSPMTRPWSNSELSRRKTQIKAIPPWNLSLWVQSMDRPRLKLVIAKSRIKIWGRNRFNRKWASWSTRQTSHLPLSDIKLQDVRCHLSAKLCIKAEPDL